jgi:anti-anti-sigma factor
LDDFDIKGDGMTTTLGTAFRYEIEESEDENKYVTTTINCHGKLVSENSAEIKALVTPLLQRGGRTVLDFSDLEHLDSSGLGALVGLKISAINRGACVLELVNLTPRIKQLLTVTNLLQMFGQKA